MNQYIQYNGRELKIPRELLITLVHKHRLAIPFKFQLTIGNVLDAMSGKRAFHGVSSSPYWKGVQLLDARSTKLREFWSPPGQNPTSVPQRSNRVYLGGGLWETFKVTKGLVKSLMALERAEHSKIITLFHKFQHKLPSKHELTVGDVEAASRGAATFWILSPQDYSAVDLLDDTHDEVSAFRSMNMRNVRKSDRWTNDGWSYYKVTRELFRTLERFSRVTT